MKHNTIEEEFLKNACPPCYIKTATMKTNDYFWKPKDKKKFIIEAI